MPRVDFFNVINKYGRQWRRVSKTILPVGLVLSTILSGCAPVIPTLPSVVFGLPPAKSATQYRVDDQQCRRYAFAAVQASPDYRNAATQSALTVGVISLLGIGAGALIGSAVGQVGAGVAVGAAYGGVAGTASGADQAGGMQYHIQVMFDTFYARCMALQGYAP